jgi:hypothetical protein
MFDTCRDRWRIVASKRLPRLPLNKIVKRMATAGT